MTTYHVSDSLGNVKVIVANSVEIGERSIIFYDGAGEPMAIFYFPSYVIAQE